MERWSDYFRRSSLGTGAYAFHPAENLSSLKLVEIVLIQGGCILSRSGMFSPVYQAMPLPGGAAFGVAQRHGFGGLGEGWKVKGPRAVRHLIRLTGMPQPTRRLSGDVAMSPSDAELSTEWEKWVAGGLEDQVAQALPWLAIDGAETFKSAEAAPRVSLPLPDAETNDVADLAEGPGKRSSLFWMTRISGRTHSNSFTVTADGVTLS